MTLKHGAKHSLAEKQCNGILQLTAAKQIQTMTRAYTLRVGTGLSASLKLLQVKTPCLVLEDVF